MDYSPYIKTDGDESVITKEDAQDFNKHWQTMTKPLKTNMQDIERRSSISGSRRYEKSLSSRDEATQTRIEPPNYNAQDER